MGLRQRLRGKAIDAYLGEGAVRWKRRLFGLGGRRLELYFQVDDPYSYLLAQVLGPLVEAAGVELDFVLVRVESGDDESERRAEHARRDAALLASEYTLSFPAEAEAPARTETNRANDVLAVARPAREQLAIAAEVAEALWSRDREALAGLASRHATRDATETLAKNGARLSRAGHYLPGMLRYGGVWYWGVDRLRHLRRHLIEDGLRAPEVLVARSAVARVSANELEMFFSFRSPYSYIAAVRAVALCERHDLRLTIRPVLPMVMRGLEVPLKKRLYIARDAAREARWHGVPFGDLCDPLGPGIQRCLAVFYRARELGREVAFVTSAGRGIWAEARDVATDEDLRALVERAGIAWPDVNDALKSESWQEETAANREALYGMGLWGVPSFRLAELCVWGNDRLDMIARRLDGSAAEMADDPAARG